MRIVLGLATALATSVLGVLGVVGAAAPAHAEICGAPAVHGFTIVHLSAHGVSCHEAQTLATHVVRGGYPHGWSCSHRLSGRHVTISCRQPHDPTVSFHVGYHVS